MQLSDVDLLYASLPAERLRAVRLPVVRLPAVRLAPLPFAVPFPQGIS